MCSLGEEKEKAAKLTVDAIEKIRRRARREAILRRREHRLLGHCSRMDVLLAFRLGRSWVMILKPDLVELNHIEQKTRKKNLG
ncbi:hypothetical protein NC652_021783 [Populus alba x Populus x berolinensis]|nr:hypothetical protein NC652_021783 [Populus alba x Populus x berolinensis]